MCCRLPVEPQRQAKSAAAATQEGRKRRRPHAVAALLELAAQAIAAAGQDQGVADADRIGGEPTGVLRGERDALVRRANGLDLGSARRRERARHIHDFAAGAWNDHCATGARLRLSRRYRRML